METENQHKLREAKQKVLLEIIQEVRILMGTNLTDEYLSRYLAVRI